MNARMKVSTHGEVPYMHSPRKMSSSPCQVSIRRGTSSSPRDRGNQPSMFFRNSQQPSPTEMSMGHGFTGGSPSPKLTPRPSSVPSSPRNHSFGRESPRLVRTPPRIVTCFTQTEDEKVSKEFGGSVDAVIHNYPVHGEHVSDARFDDSLSLHSSISQRRELSMREYLEESISGLLLDGKLYKVVPLSNVFSD